MLLHKGAFNNYVDKREWVGGQSIVYVCLRRVGGWSVKCLRRHFVVLLMWKVSVDKYSEEDGPGKYFNFKIRDANSAVFRTFIYFSVLIRATLTNKDYPTLISLLQVKEGTYCHFQGWSFLKCLHRQVMGGQSDVYVCLQGVDGWSKKGKNMST